jgi:hypothetical protein
MRLHALAFLVTTLLLTSCTAVRSPAPLRSYPRVLGTYHSTIGYIPVGRLIENDTSFVPEGGGYGIVLLRRGSIGRGQRACINMLNAMRMRVGPADGEPLRSDDTLVHERPIYWPVTIRSPAKCARMLQNYDYDRAMINLQRIPNWSQLGQGPFVVVRKQDGNQAGFFDFSNVAAADFNEQFAAVVNYMTQKPDVWSPEFYHTATFRQRMRRYVLERSGEAPKVIASLINLTEG